MRRENIRREGPTPEREQEAKGTKYRASGRAKWHHVSASRSGGASLTLTRRSRPFLSWLSEAAVRGVNTVPELSRRPPRPSSAKEGGSSSAIGTGAVVAVPADRS